MPTLETYFSKLENIKVIDSSIPNAQYIPIDLSVNNMELSTINLQNSNDFETFIKNYLRTNKAKVAFGGYNETRNLYRKNSLFDSDAFNERNIHIGMDFWTNAGTLVLAAVDGTVYGFDYNAGAGNYGPTIILKHHFENHTFYTLYGHLSVKSIEDIEIGMHFQKGQEIATLGDSAINGGYAPHLHFQIIKNIEANLSDYPGVCSKENLEYYLENCPDPHLLLKIQ